MQWVSAISTLLVLLPVVMGGVVMGGCNTAPPPSPGVKGQEHYTNYCAPCHGEDGHGNPDIAAPSIAGLPDWYIEEQVHKFRMGSRGRHFDDIEGLRMRPMSLALASDASVAEVSKYVAALKPYMPARTLEGDAKAGAKLYLTCQACHGEKALGNKDLHSPPLTQTHDWYLVSQLKKLKDGVRGADERDQWGATMVPMAQALTDETQMRDVVAHIMTLRGK